MSRIVKVGQSNYRVKVQTGGTITFDTGYDPNISGPLPAPDNTVVITGDLLVLGDSTTVNTTNLSIEDNILIINREVDANGDLVTHTGITLGQAGIEIDRGTLSNAQLLFDEDVEHYDPLISTDKAGTFVFKTADNALSGIQLNSIAITGGTDLVFDMKNTNRILQVVNSDATAYADRFNHPIATITDTPEDNYIVNKKFVLAYVAASGGSADVSHIQYPASAPIGTEQSSVQALSSSVRLSINHTQRAQITTNGLDVDDINLFGHTITSTGSYNLILTAANNNVEVNAILNLDDQSGSVSGTSGKNKIYSKAILSVRNSSGVFFANNVKAEELVSRSRALLYSMLF